MLIADTSVGRSMKTTCSSCSKARRHGPINDRPHARDRRHCKGWHIAAVVARGWEYATINGPVVWSQITSVNSGPVTEPKRLAKTFPEVEWMRRLERCWWKR